MKKWYSIGLLVIAVVLAASFMVACGGDEATETTAAPTETTAAATETTAAPAAGGVDVNTIGVYFEDQGNNVVKVTDVPAPGLQFPITTAGEFAFTIEVLDASGAVLGTLQTDDGLVDYTEFAANAAKIKFTSAAGDVFEYEIGM